MNYQDEYNEVLKLLDGMDQFNMILYVGINAKRGELSEAVCNLPWRCVVTSQRREDFGREFAQGRRPQRYTQYNNLPANLFDKVNLPIIQIYGREEPEDVDPDDADDKEMTSLRRKKNAEKIIGRIFGRMDMRCKMVVIGYEPDNPEEFPIDDFLVYSDEMQGGSIVFCGLCEEEQAEGKMQKCIHYASKKGYLCFSQSFSELLNKVEQGSVDFEAEERYEDNRYLFYKGQRPVTIDTSILLQCRNFAQLLTDESVYRIRPQGKIQQSMWYYDFLNDSSIGPQWYGYLPQSDFHLKREFEDDLVNLVRDIIAGKKGRVHGMMPIVILEGDPGSSKSITLGALAYRIYNEKINPVVFIKNDDLLFNSANSPEFDQLDELLQVIEDLGDKDVRTLVIWDSATYRNIVDLSAELARRLDNRGRKFILVCTAYRGASQSVNKEFIRNDSTLRDNVINAGEFYFVETTRTMTDNEVNQFQRQVKRLMNIDSDTFRRVWERLENEGNRDIFNYFYTLVDLIRPNLEQELTHEQIAVGSYVQKQLVLLGAEERKEEQFRSPFYQALLDAGISITEEDNNSLEEDTGELINYDLDRFNICIAMFGRFKLDVPYTLGIHMLYKDDYEGAEEAYQNRELFELVTNDIPWIYYVENVRGDFVLKFRNSLEAELFLDKNNIDSERQMKMICEMLDFYVEVYNREGCEDENLMNSIQQLLRMMGPNTTYPLFRQGGSKSQEHFLFLQDLDKIIDKLSDIRIRHRIPDTDAGFATIEITFTREFYGKLWGNFFPDLIDKESFMKRTEKLAGASNLALQKISQLEDSRAHADKNKQSRYTARINALSVEIAYCNIELEKLLQDYILQFGEEFGTAFDIKKYHTLPYSHCFQNLVKAIMTDPFNGYTYNALFSLFENEYHKAGNSEERRLQLLSEVRVYADDAVSLDIHDRGMNDRDELSEHIGKIMEYSDGFQISIDDLMNGNEDSSFVKLFNQLLEKNNASGIIFVCQRELDQAGLGKQISNISDDQNRGEVILNEQQLAVCRKILDFMQQEEYESCVDKNPYALYLMLRVYWMYANKRPINSNREAQLTYIDLNGWREISTICEKYTNCCGTNRRPMVVLIQALALVHLKKDYIGACRIMDSLSEDLFGSQNRMRVPYILCNELGEPYTYSGTVLSVKNNTGFIQVDGIPKQLGRNTGIRFYMKNLGLRNMPAVNEIKQDLELGLGYTGFSLYTKEGRIRLEEEYR